MDRWLAALVLLLAIALLGFLSMSGDEARVVSAEDSRKAAPAESAVEEPANALLAQLVVERPENSQGSAASRLEPVREEGTRAEIYAEHEEWLDEAMDWSQPKESWKPRLQQLTNERLLVALRDDRIEDNAIITSHVLAKRLCTPATAKRTRLLLEAALESAASDFQQRRVVAGLLQAHALACQEHDPHAPSETLIEYSIGFVGKQPTSNCDGDFAGAVRQYQFIEFALRFAESMEPQLLRALRCSDESNEFDLAFVLAKSGCTRETHLIAPVLIEHTHSNRRRNDALMSMEAFVELGPGAAGWLWAEYDTKDEQQRKCIQLLLEELSGSADSPAEREKRAGLNVVTHKYANPIRSWRYLKDHGFEEPSFVR